ncbi:LOW QUALITY PROTEIN: Hypothetical protein PHPALM_17272 [Phytophthora palmivora]|uniref:Chromo domain-containing protein n=1 Tax=Phytophthora palmivora TaxID=4796 RepID=A0A2P4XMN6_9STRA|nr:LOW QUALITY PROTEIN: Hypothetical protein PHPALM_17272 [Phytophthora palmivora]
MFEHGLSSSEEEEFKPPVRRRGRRNPRRPRTPPCDSVQTDSLGPDEERYGCTPVRTGLRVACPPRNAAVIAKLPELSRKHFLRDLKLGEIDQFCVIVVDDATSIEAGAVDAEDPASDGRTRPKGAESKSAREARYAAQSLPALEASGNPSADTSYRDSVHGTDPSLVNGVITRSAVRDTSRGMCTRSATVAAPDNTTKAPTHQSNIAAWTSRTLINPSMSRRAVEYHDTAGAAPGTAPPSANFDPNPESQPLDTAAVHEFTQRRQTIVRYVRDAIAMAVDCQKENADRRGRKNMEKFAVGDRVLLSTAGIQPTLVTNLGANKLAPQYIGPFKVLKVLGTDLPFERDGPAPLVNSAGNIRHIVEAIQQHDDSRAAPRKGRGARRRVETVPAHRQYLVRWPGPMPDSWEPREDLLADVPDCVAAYETSVASVTSSLNGAITKRQPRVSRLARFKLPEKHGSGLLVPPFNERGPRAIQGLHGHGPDRRGRFAAC